jgi:hypothetical protein
MANKIKADKAHDILILFIGPYLIPKNIYETIYLVLHLYCLVELRPQAELNPRQRYGRFGQYYLR